MVTRREFLETLAVGAAAVGGGNNRKELCANSRLQRPPEFCGDRPEQPRLRASLFAEGKQECGARILTSAMWMAISCESLRRAAEKEMGEAPATAKDFRKILELKDVDAITIASPDHWHAPMAIAGLQAGKHVYVEKPCSHNPAEGAMLVEAQRKYGKLVQMGTQQRSSPHTIEIIGKIHDGADRTRLLARRSGMPIRGNRLASARRSPCRPNWIGICGRDRRRAAPYKDNYHPYNWHLFRMWGTGETLNNGTHEVDVCRWALGVDYPKSVSCFRWPLPIQR